MKERLARWLQARLINPMVRRHPVIAYFTLAYAISWAIWIPMAVMGARVYPGVAWPTHWPGLFGPLVAAFLVTAATSGRTGILDLLRRMFRWRVHPIWYLAALSPLILFAAAAGVMVVTGQGSPDFAGLGMFSGLPAAGIGLVAMMLLATTFGEEVGWRGFAVPELQKKRSLLATALVVGVLWAAWHGPTFLFIENYRQLGMQFLPGFAIGIVAGSILLAWLYNRSGGSILIVSLWHAAFNLTSGTAAAHGLVAAFVSTGVMVWAAFIVVAEARQWWRDRQLRSVAMSRTQPGGA